MKYIFCINGKAGAGKDTFVDFCKNFSKVTNYSAIDEIKEIAKQIGWSGEKNEKSRKMLADLKDIADQYSDFSTKKLEEKIKEFFSEKDQEILFLHIRDPKQMEDLKRLHPGIIDTILVTNNRVPDILSNQADKKVICDYVYDHIVENNGTLEELKGQAESFVQFLRDQ